MSYVKNSSMEFLKQKNEYWIKNNEFVTPIFKNVIMLPLPLLNRMKKWQYL